MGERGGLKGYSSKTEKGLSYQYDGDITTQSLSPYPHSMKTETQVHGSLCTGQTPHKETKRKCSQVT